GDIPNLHRALAFAGEVQADSLLALVVTRRDDGEGLAELIVEGGLRELDALNLRQRHTAKPILRQHIELRHLDELILSERLTLLLHTDHKTRDGLGLADGGTRIDRRQDLDLLAAHLVEEVAHRRVAGEIDGERLEGQLNRL